METSISNTRKAKQCYLIDNIIKTGSDAEQFQLFLMERRQGGTFSLSIPRGQH